MKTKQNKGLWVSHGQVTHPYSERKKCKFCIEVLQEWESTMDKLRTRVEGKVKATCLFKNMITGKPLSENCEICQKYLKGEKKGNK